MIYSYDRIISGAKWVKYWTKYILEFLIFIGKYSLWSPIVFAGQCKSQKCSVFFGYRKLPQLTEKIRGGLVKFQRLNQYIPNSIKGFNILYLGSSALPPNWRQILLLARTRKAKIVLNQNGVMYPKHGAGWQVVNYPLKQLLEYADYVFYQSRFCQFCADKFLIKKSGNSEILYNCVDTAIFKPLPSAKDNKIITLLLGGNQYERYRFEVALQTLAILLKGADFKVELLVTGELNWIKDRKSAASIAQNLAQTFNVQNSLKFTGSYSQKEAPLIYNQAHVLLHTKHNDPCPGLVIEAMACGLPIVASNSGGVPELVGTDAGKCIKVAQGWDSEIRPDAGALADAVIEVVDKLDVYSEAARQRAVEKFDIHPWVNRHREVFNLLLHDV